MALNYLGSTDVASQLWLPGWHLGLPDKLPLLVLGLLCSIATPAPGARPKSWQVLSQCWFHGYRAGCKCVYKSASVPASANLQDPDITFPLPVPKLQCSNLCCPVLAGPWPSLQPPPFCVSFVSALRAPHLVTGDIQGVDCVSFVCFPFDPHSFLCCLVGTRIGIQVTQAQTWELRTSRNFSVPGVSCLPSLHLGNFIYWADMKIMRLNSDLAGRWCVYLISGILSTWWPQGAWSAMPVMIWDTVGNKAKNTRLRVRGPNLGLLLLLVCFVSLGKPLKLSGCNSFLCKRARALKSDKTGLESHLLHTS